MLILPNLLSTLPFLLLWSSPCQGLDTDIFLVEDATLVGGTESIPGNGNIFHWNLLECNNSVCCVFSD
jgi:hypothetical protein